MSVVAEEASFTLAQVQRLQGLSRSTVLQLIEAGFVTPSRGARNEYRFSFRDMVLLRTAHELRQAEIPTRRILQALRRVRDALPTSSPVTQLRLTAHGQDVAVQQGDRRYLAATGQLLLDLDVSEPKGTVTVLSRTTPQGDERSASDWFAEGEAVESSDPEQAEAAYRTALRIDPGHVDAYLNLGALLCDLGRSSEAISLYDQALQRRGDVALLHYNRAVALEEVGKPEAAISNYGKALQLDSSLSDAHFNLARIHQDLGHQQLALRHFSAFRRLEKHKD